MNKELLKAAQEHVFNSFKASDKRGLVYHNYNHTHEVVQASKDIAEGIGVKGKDLELLLLSAWFHDIGYLKKYKGHEQIGAEHASTFLKEQNVPDEDILIVQNAILATTFPQKPKTLLEEILCDADLSHIGSKDYLDKSQLLKLEWELTGENQSEDKKHNSDLNFLVEHSFHTDYAQLKMAERKGKNLVKLQEIKDRQDEKIATENDKINRLESKKNTPERGVETMYRVSFKNHMELSGIADNKANIMLSINAIIISISLSTLIPNFSTNTKLILPTIVLLLVCIVTIVFATLSTRPKTSKKEVSNEPFSFDKTSLLFFGNFYKMKLEDFEEKMEELKKSKNLLYSSLTKDLYNLGVVLGRKYKYLRYCYNIFMYGMILTVLVFVIMFLWAPSDQSLALPVI